MGFMSDEDIARFKHSKRWEAYGYVTYNAPQSDYAKELRSLVRKYGDRDLPGDVLITVTAFDLWKDYQVKYKELTAKIVPT